MTTFGNVTLLAILAEVVMYFIPHSIIFDCLNMTIGATAFIFFIITLIASKNEKFRNWCRKKFYF